MTSNKLSPEALAVVPEIAAFLRHCADDVSGERHLHQVAKDGLYIAARQLELQVEAAEAAKVTMVQGRKYLVQHRSESQRRDRGSVMRFMAEKENSYLFDARPAHGTQEMPKSWVIDIVPVADNVAPYCDVPWQ